MPEPKRRTRLRLIVGCLAVALIVAPLAWFWNASRLPASFQLTDMGRPDFGGHAGHHDHAGRSLTSFTADPARPADVTVKLVARKEKFTLGTGKRFDGYTLNGQSPGPLIQAVQGQLVEVTLVNETVPDGITLHWHGIDVPNAADGVAGVTQDAVATGQQYVYRFVAGQAGTFWYHSHRLSHHQVSGGLLGPIVIAPKTPLSGVDTVALHHLYGGNRTVNGLAEQSVLAAPGQSVRVRVINTDNGLLSAWVAGAPFRVAAIDGTEVNEPGKVDNVAVPVPAGGRADLELTMPADGGSVRVQLAGAVSIVLGSTAAVAPTVPRPKATLDLLSYGKPAALGFEPANATRTFRYDIGRRPGFIDGRPGLFWTVNGHLYPDIPMFMVTEGDIVRMTISNGSGETHPMHLHGHHAVVLARDGVAATGSPWWTDSLEVGNGESYEIAFVADNPGLWMDHCHNLPHAAEGLMAHLMYEGVSTPFRLQGVPE